MRAARMTANLRVADVEGAKSCCTDYLGRSRPKAARGRREVAVVQPQEPEPTEERSPMLDSEETLLLRHVSNVLSCRDCRFSHILFDHDCEFLHGRRRPLS